MRIPVLLSATLALTATSLTSQTPAPPSDIDRHVAQVMREFEVPGMSLAVVRDGRVVLAKGYGVKALGSPAAVDVRTRFGIASNTKAFTATALALLVEEGKLEWDAPAIRYLPNFALYDPFVTFPLNPDGSIDQMKMQAASPSVDFSFDFQDLLFKPKAASAR